MPDLLHARAVGLSMGRNPANLVCSTVFSGVEADDFCFDGPKFVVRSEVMGGSEGHSVIIMVPLVTQKDLMSTKKLPLSRRLLYRARWHCDCSDFRFTFYPHIEGNGENILQFPVYVPNGRGAPRAIAEFGCCKHINAVIEDRIHNRVFSRE